MKKTTILAAAVILLAASIATADPTPPPGLHAVSHDATLTGTGTGAVPLKLAPCSTNGQSWVWNTGAWACATVGGVTGTGTSGDLAVFTGASAVGNFAGSSPTACAAGQSLTQVTSAATGALTLVCSTNVSSVAAGTGISASTTSGAATVGLNINGGTTQTCGAGQSFTSITGVGIVSCSTFSTLTNVAGANAVVKSDGANLVATNATDDGTTFTIATGTPSVSVVESTAKTLINSPTTPADSQLTLKANSLGALSFLSFAADNEQINFDYERVGSSQFARSTTVGAFGKITGMFRWYGKTGATLNASVTPTEIAALDLGTGNLEIMGGLGCGELTNAAATCKINAVGYSNGTTQFRDLEIDDGKGTAIATFAGSTKAVTLNGDATTGIAADRTTLTANQSGTFDTTAAQRNSYAAYFNNTSSVSTGALALNGYGIYATSVNATNNYAAWLDGDVKLRSGVTIKEAGAGTMVLDSLGGVIQLGTGTNLAIVKVEGMLYAAGTAPTVGTCGTSPTISGQNNGGIVTVGTGSPTACTVTFGNGGFTAEPACTISTRYSGTAYISAKSASAFTVTNISGTMTKFDYTCMGN